MEKMRHIYLLRDRESYQDDMSKLIEILLRHNYEVYLKDEGFGVVVNFVDSESDIENGKITYVDFDSEEIEE